MTCTSTEGGLVKLYIGGPLDNGGMFAKLETRPKCVVVFCWDETSQEYEGNSYVSPGINPEFFKEQME